MSLLVCLSFLQYMSSLEVLACSLDTNLNYKTTMLQLYPLLNHLVKLWQLLGEDGAICQVYFYRQIFNPNSTLSWTWTGNKIKAAQVNTFLKHECGKINICWINNSNINPKYYCKKNAHNFYNIFWRRNLKKMNSY